MNDILEMIKDQDSIAKATGEYNQYTIMLKKAGEVIKAEREAHENQQRKLIDIIQKQQDEAVRSGMEIQRLNNELLYCNNRIKFWKDIANGKKRVFEKKENEVKNNDT